MSETGLSANDRVLCWLHAKILKYMAKYRDVLTTKVLLPETGDSVWCGTQSKHQRDADHKGRVKATSSCGSGCGTTPVLAEGI